MSAIFSFVSSILLGLGRFSGSVFCIAFLKISFSTNDLEAVIKSINWELKVEVKAVHSAVNSSFS